MTDNGTLKTEIMQSEQILIVDDEPEVVSVLEDCCRRAGVRFSGATSVREAEEIFRSTRTYLILTDFRMPEEDGVSFFDRMRTINPNTVGVLITANADKTAAMRALRVGLLDIIEKPFKTHVVIELIKREFEKRASVLSQEAAALTEISEGFAREATEILGNIDELVMHLENDDDNRKHVIDNLFRRVHTIKGCARSIPNTESIFQISHAWETLLSTYRDGTASPSPEDIDNMLLAADALRKCVSLMFSELPKVSEFSDLLALLSLKKTKNILESDDGIIWTDEVFAETNKKEAKTSHSDSAGSVMIQSSANKKAHPAEHHQTITIDAKKIDSFMEVTGELVVLKNSLQSILDGFIREHAEASQCIKPISKQLSEITLRLQKDVLAIRRVKFETVVQSLHRTVREVARGLGKQIKLEIEGGEVEIDRDIARRLSPALVHLVRNSCDHGVETPIVRQQSGKSMEGTIAIRGQVKNGILEVVIRDDGKGLDKSRILAKAIERQIITTEKAATLRDADIFDFIFHPGFSTATVVSDVSGRGVGMDVVRSEVDALGGTVRIESENGKGASFTLAIPEVKSVMVEKLIVFRLPETKIALPIGAVSTIFRFGKERVVCLTEKAQIEFEDQLQPLLRPHELFKSLAPHYKEISGGEKRMGVLLKQKSKRIVLEVEDIEKQLDAVIRPLDETTRNIPSCKGVALLSEEDLAYALDIDRIFSTLYDSSK